MVDVYAIKIDREHIKLIFQTLTACLQYNMKEKIKRFAKIDDVYRSLVGDVLIRMIICNKLGIKNREITFLKNEYGKPFLKKYDNFYYNISHSGEWVVCATHTLPIGIDIEHIEPIDFHIAKRFFSKEEYNELLSKDSSTKLSYFFDLWTLKESYVKAVGLGLSIPLNSFTIVSNKDTILIKNGAIMYCYFKQYIINQEYKLSVCASERSFCDNIKYIKIDDLLDFAEKEL